MQPKIVSMHVAPDEERRELHVALMEYNYGIQILVDGYGLMISEPGTNGILCLEKDLETGHLMLYIWGDITNDDVTHVIDLEGANEELREEEDEYA